MRYTLTVIERSCKHVVSSHHKERAMEIQGRRKLWKNYKFKNNKFQYVGIVYFNRF